MNDEKLILVDRDDNVTGTAGKLEVHQQGLLHRAFSVFIFNSSGEMLLQQRAMGKYHSAGLWSNACCSHPRVGENTTDAVARRLKEELGFSADTRFAFHFIYKTSFTNGLTEHEFDHVYTGIYDGAVDFNRQEVMDVCFKSMRELQRSLEENAGQYTSWFAIAFPLILEWHQRNFAPLITGKE